MTGRASTDGVIARLSAQAGPPAAALARLRRGVAAVGLGAAALAAALSFRALGWRPDLPGALMIPEVALKFLFPLGIGLSAAIALMRAGQPGRPVLSAAVAAPALAALAAGLALWAAHPGPAPAFASPRACLTAILLLSLPGLGAGLLALRAGAPVRPALAGAAAGALAGAGAALGYALYCPVDQARFVVLWYGTGMLVAAAVGALAGRRFAAW